MTFTGTLASINARWPPDSPTRPPACLSVRQPDRHQRLAGTNDTDVLVWKLSDPSSASMNDVVETPEDGGGTVINVLANDRPNPGQRPRAKLTLPTARTVTLNKNGTDTIDRRHLDLRSSADSRATTASHTPSTIPCRLKTRTRCELTATVFVTVTRQ